MAAPTAYVIVSADNSEYFAWQAKLFHYSCVTRVGVVPLIFVHGAATRELAPGFDDIVRAGGVVCRVPSFRATATGERYAPRNNPGTLVCAAELCDDDDAWFVMCDADMIFTRAPDFARRLSADRYDYLDFNEPRIRDHARRMGATPEVLDAAAGEQQSGVPYIMPASLARPFAEKWFEVIDAFEGRNYVDSMYAFSIAAAALGLPVARTSHMMTNFDHTWPATADIVHYGYGDIIWDKRRYGGVEDVSRVWHPAPATDSSSVYGEIARQLVEAREWYDGFKGSESLKDDDAEGNRSSRE